jgi:hypothetical protein
MLFRSDPVLLSGENEIDNNMLRPAPPPCNLVGDSNDQNNAELDMDCQTRSIRDLISQYQTGLEVCSLFHFCSSDYQVPFTMY